MVTLQEMPRLVEPGWEDRVDLGDGRALLLYIDRTDDLAVRGFQGRWRHAPQPSTWTGLARFEHVCDRGERGVIVCAPLLQPEHSVTGEWDGPGVNVSPSILCPDCGTHGWIRDGRWTDA